ncbi:hypothetical protein KDA23_04320, partial [Candidatus Saccharibacteria bacterium]|nr:hypothetical protein [Candidatus Saccharibacteria bacterium]
MSKKLNQVKIAKRTGVFRAWAFAALMAFATVSVIGYKFPASTSAVTSAGAICGSGYKKLISANAWGGGEILGTTVLMTNGEKLCGVFVAKGAADNGKKKAMHLRINKGTLACLKNLDTGKCIKKDKWHGTSSDFNTAFFKPRYKYEFGKYKQYVGPLYKAKGKKGTVSTLTGEMMYKGKVRWARV